MGTDIRHAVPTLATAPSDIAPDLKRRRFLFAVGAGGAAAASVAAGAAPSAAAQLETAATQTDDSASGYRVTEHVRDYYRTTKI